MDAMGRTGRKPPTINSALPPLPVPVTVAAQLIGVGRSTLWVLIKRQEVETSRVGRKRLVLHASLQAFIESRRVKDPSSNRRA
jgi:excisionase family DNA binding protein